MNAWGRWLQASLHGQLCKVCSGLFLRTSKPRLAYALLPPLFLILYFPAIIRTPSSFETRIGLQTSLSKVRKLLSVLVGLTFTFAFFYAQWTLITLCSSTGENSWSSMATPLLSE
ncbi:hypothetical protein M8818_006147 [Zalaria obscura]|uniref:Uncharacterized protein n=1 Tax=Zalaria obscura TaxID=2024903 RepID=A0ACC3S820_9PEZI